MPSDKGDEPSMRPEKPALLAKRTRIKRCGVMPGRTVP